MPPIGDTLRDARLRQRLDIAEVEQATKIRGKYLRALESEEFDRLPGSTFVRTFLRTYAEYLGLDSQLLLEEYRQRHESPRDDEMRPLAPPPPSVPPREGRRRPQLGPPSRGAMIVGAVVALLALLLVVGLLTGDEGDEASETPAARPGQGQGQGQGQGSPQRGQDKEEDATLRITPLAETYLCVENGAGEEIFEQTIAAPETFEAQTLRVNFGNTQVELELNGEELAIEQAANPVGYEFTADGEEELPEGERPCA
jgi:cytoskeleton protein RodZ